jgi:hypothetical protein
MRYRAGARTCIIQPGMIQATNPVLPGPNRIGLFCLSPLLAAVSLLEPGLTLLLICATQTITAHDSDYPGTCLLSLLAQLLPGHP